MSTKKSDERRFRVVVVGAGLGGISASIALKTQLGISDFVVYEKASQPGGTWRDNTYPGCGSDAPAHWYSLSTELNPNWKTPFAEQQDLQNYWLNIFNKHKLSEHTQFNTSVISAEWKEETQRYTVILEDATSGERDQIETQAIIFAIGGFRSPLIPSDLKGISTFKGLSWHSANWRHDVDLRGKRVGVIGNGCSAAQIVPAISADPSVQVTNFARTPQWYVPRQNGEFPPAVKWMFAYIPFLLRWYRNSLCFRAEFVSLFVFHQASPLLGLFRRLLTRYIAMKAPKDQLDKLVPQYPPGCKRLIVDPGYLACLHQPNVSLEWDHIIGYEENGIKLEGGKFVPLDIIIFATGYVVDPVDFQVTGRGGITLLDYYKSHGGPTAYLGTCVPGFPNLFTILGPNVATGHASIVFSEETQINLTMKLLAPVVKGEAQSIDVKPEACDDYNKWLQSRLSKTVWTECHSFYHAGRTQGGKVTATFPGPISLLWWFSKTAPWENWRVTGGKGWERKQRWKKWCTRFLLLVGAIAAVEGWYLGWLKAALGIYRAYI